MSAEVYWGRWREAVQHALGRNKESCWRLYWELGYKDGMRPNKQ
jgi:hypothetical protein